MIAPKGKLYARHVTERGAYYVTSTEPRPSRWVRCQTCGRYHDDMDPSDYCVPLMLPGTFGLVILAALVLAALFVVAWIITGTPIPTAPAG